MRYHVSQTLQSGDNDPVTIAYGSNLRPEEASSVLTLLVAQAEEAQRNDDNHPINPLTRSITVTLTET